MTAAVLRGRVDRGDGTAFSGVSITILDHPEFGSTLSRADGMFDMAVNGGGPLTVIYDGGNGYLPVQRQIDVPWRDYVWLPDVVLTPLDSRVTTVSLSSSSSSMQVAHGSQQSDTSGTRQATLLFPAGTTATMTTSGGSQPLSAGSVRATEYTVGSSGPHAMPAALPPNSAYTYAVELSVDEAQSARATSVTFNQPVFFYLENFLGFPVGTVAPAGYYDKSRGVWVASDSGQVIQILTTAGGTATVDTNGDGVADNNLNMSSSELQTVAQLYQPGQQLWRVPITHFSSWDINWGWGPPQDARTPGTLPVQPADSPQTCENTSTGSIIGCQSQTLGEAVSVVGTPFSLHYQNERQVGRTTARTLNIPLSNGPVPASLQRIDVQIQVAGQIITESFPTTATSTVFTWDGKDAYGRVLQGTQPLTIQVGYVYRGVYENTSRFGYNGNGTPITASRTLQEITLWQVYRTGIGSWDALPEGLGGWTLSVHHLYDPVSQILYLGTGERFDATSFVVSVISTVAGSSQTSFCGDGGPATSACLASPRSVAVTPDGAILIADVFNNRIRRVGPDGIISTVAGNGQRGFCGDGGPATNACLNLPGGVAIAPDGAIIIADSVNSRIRRVGPDGIISTIAGNGQTSFCGDGGPATSACLASPPAVAVAPDGAIFIVDSGPTNGGPDSHFIRRVGPDGIISTVAGNGQTNFTGDGGPATSAGLGPVNVTVAPDGAILIVDGYNSRIRRVGLDGIISTVAGNGQNDFCGDGGSATSACFHNPHGITVSPDGAILIGDGYNSRIRRVGPDGIISTIAGNGQTSFCGDGGPATSGCLTDPLGIAVAPDGAILVADSDNNSNNHIRRVGSATPTFALGEFGIASQGGSLVYRFSRTGRHLSTLNSLTGATILNFSYDQSGLLSAVTDSDGNVTQIEHDGSGNPAALVAPFGQRTTVAVDGNGYLATITDPAGETTAFTYSNGGLMHSMTDPRSNVHQFSYDSLGRLSLDQDPAGGSQSLARADASDGFTVTRTTGENRTTTYQVQRLSTGDNRRLNTAPDGTQTEVMFGTNGTEKTTSPDGTVDSLQQGPDPRFGMQAPIVSTDTVSTPGGLVFTANRSRSVTLSTPTDPLSLASETDTTTINGNTFTSLFNAPSRTLTLTSSEGRQTSKTIDAVGRLLSSQLSGLNPTTFTYDAKGRISTATSGSGSVQRLTSLSYNPQGFLDTLTNPLGMTTSFGYDSAGRVTSETLPDGRVVGFGYDPNGNVASVTPPARPAHSLIYTPVDLLGRYTPPSLPGTGATQYAYNKDRQLTLMTRPDGTTVGFAYNSFGQLSSLTTSRGATSYNYDGAGRVASISAPGGETISLGYAGFLPLSESWTGGISGNVTRVFDNNFRLTTETLDGSESLSFIYDRDGLLTGAGSLSLSRDPQNGLVTGTALGNLSDTFGYSGFGELASYAASSGSSSLFTVAYTRDNLGRITEKTETVEGVTDTYDYSYDAVGRLVGVTLDGATVSSYSYDSNGNRTSYSGSLGTATGSYDDQDRLLSYGAESFTYTANGELASKTDSSGVTNYIYDALGNLQSVSLPNGTQVAYVIDGRNRRIGKKVNGTLGQGFLYDGQLRVVAELDGSNNLVSQFAYGSKANTPDYMVKGGNTYRIISDHLGSPRLVVDVNSGAIVQHMTYDEFGNVISDSSPGFQPFGFAAGIYDRDTGLVRFGARDYDPFTGRWTAKDPILFSGRDTNLYGYALGNPISNTDPLGLWSLTVDAYEGFGGGIVFGQDPTTHKWFYGGRLGIGVGGGFSFDFEGKRPGADQTSSSCGPGTSVGTIGAIGGQVGPYQWNVRQFAAGINFPSRQSYEEEPTPGPLTFGPAVGIDVGVFVGFEVMGYQ